MASSSFSLFKRRFVLASSVLLLFIPPISSLLVFFWPLIVSTLLGVLAVVSFGQQGGIPILQEKDTLDQSRLLVSPPNAADTKKIGDVLMVGNEEVTWLEWLHNEDMEKCRAQGDASCMPGTWNLDELDVAQNQDMEEYHLQRHMDCLPGRWDLDELDVAHTERIEDMEKCHTHGRASYMLGREDLDELDMASEASVCTLALRSEKKSTVGVNGSVITDESFTIKQYDNVANDMIAVSLNATLHDATVKLCEENCLFPSQTSKVMSTTDASNLSIRKEGILLISDTEALMRPHTLGENTKERDFWEDNGGAIHKGHAQERDCGEHSGGFLRDANDNEENKSCLRFSFFDNGGLTLESSKA